MIYYKIIAKERHELVSLDLPIDVLLNTLENPVISKRPISKNSPLIKAILIKIEIETDINKKEQHFTRLLEYVDLKTHSEKKRFYTHLKEHMYQTDGIQQIPFNIVKKILSSTVYDKEFYRYLCDWVTYQSPFTKEEKLSLLKLSSLGIHPYLLSSSKTLSKKLEKGYSSKEIHGYMRDLFPKMRHYQSEQNTELLIDNVRFIIAIQYIDVKDGLMSIQTHLDEFNYIIQKFSEGMPDNYYTEAKTLLLELITNYPHDILSLTVDKTDIMSQLNASLQILTQTGANSKIETAYELLNILLKGTSSTSYSTNLFLSNLIITLFKDLDISDIRQLSIEQQLSLSIQIHTIFSDRILHDYTSENYQLLLTLSNVCFSLLEQSLSEEQYSQLQKPLLDIISKTPKFIFLARKGEKLINYSNLVLNISQYLRINCNDGNEDDPVYQAEAKWLEFILREFIPRVNEQGLLHQEDTTYLIKFLVSRFEQISSNSNLMEHLEDNASKNTPLGYYLVFVTLQKSNLFHDTENIVSSIEWVLDHGSISTQDRFFLIENLIKLQHYEKAYMYLESCLLNENLKEGYQKKVLNYLIEIDMNINNKLPESYIQLLLKKLDPSEPNELNQIVSLKLHSLVFYLETESKVELFNYTELVTLLSNATSLSADLKSQYALTLSLLGLAIIPKQKQPPIITRLIVDSLIIHTQEDFEKTTNLLRKGLLFPANYPLSDTILFSYFRVLKEVVEQSSYDLEPATTRQKKQEKLWEIFYDCFSKTKFHTLRQLIGIEYKKEAKSPQIDYLIGINYDDTQLAETNSKFNEYVRQTPDSGIGSPTQEPPGPKQFTQEIQLIST